MVENLENKIEKESGKIQPSKNNKKEYLTNFINYIKEYITEMKKYSQEVISWLENRSPNDNYYSKTHHSKYGWEKNIVHIW